jgi:hypothetical protein
MKLERLPQFVRAMICLLGALSASARPAHAEEPELNPYECLGRYEAATGNRTIGQIEKEITKRLGELDNPDEPKSVNAMKHCVVAMLKSRAGHSDAPEHYARAVQDAPNEPGYELFYGTHYSLYRGARGPVLELAEQHFYTALEKLRRLEKQNRYRPHHATVEDWTKKRLLVLYQQDGLQLLPGKGYPQKPSGLGWPGVAVGAIVGISQDTRDFNRRGDWNEMRTFSGEADFANSDLRAGGANRPEVGRGLTDREIWDLPRAPLRYQLDTKLRLRQNAIGALDATYYRSHAEKAQVTSFYFPTQNLADVQVEEYGVGYERVFALYPLFDVKLMPAFKLGSRTGIVEFLPQEKEDYRLYEGRLSVSRFLGADKLTAELGYTLVDMVDPPGPDLDRLREKHVRSAKLEYALYSPLVLPKFEHGSFGSMRTPTRGWYFYLGVTQDDEVYGIRTVTKRDLFAGTRFEGSGAWDVTLQGTYGTSTQTYAAVESASVFSDRTQEFAALRTNLTPQYRFVDPDALPGVASGFDSLMLVLPLSHDLGLTGRKDYENLRGGAELWAKLFVTPIHGAPLLFTAGYNYQYFYNISKGLHLFQANLRLGWGEL